MRKFLSKHNERVDRVECLREEGGFRAVLSSPRAVLDVLSVTVGVGAIAVFSGALAATVVAATPWAQDEAAKGALDSVRTAQSVYYAENAGPAGTAGATYVDMETLVAEGLIQALPDVTITGVSATTYRATVKSASGKYFYVTAEDPTPKVTDAP